MRSPMQVLVAAVGASAMLVACAPGDGPSNVPPAATFAAQCGTLACTFTNGSTDTDGEIEAYAWDFGDKTAPATSRDASHTYTKAGRFSVTLRVTDDDGETAAATTAVDVKAPTLNTAPTARFTGSCSEFTCTFTDQSFDPDLGGRVVAYVWEFGDGSPELTSRNATHTYLVSGSYRVRLTVLDNAGAAGIATQDIDLVGPNKAPDAFFTYSCADLTCSFTDHSVDPDGSVMSWSWNFGDGATSTDPTPEHSFAVAGVYHVTLTVADDLANWDLVANTIVVPPPPAPTFDFSVRCTGNVCSFTDETTPQDGRWVFWGWDFGDGEVGGDQNPTHVYQVSEPTTFTVTMTVWDWDLGGGAVTHQVTVSP